MTSGHDLPRPQEKYTPTDPVEKAMGTAISNALDGYAKDSETWIRARQTFTAALSTHRHGTIEEALRLALEAAEDGAECEPTVASERFWQSLPEELNESPEEYQELMRQTAARIDALTASPSAKPVVPTPSEPEQTGLYVRIPEVGSVQRLVDSESGKVTYGITDVSHGPVDDQIDKYAWSEGDHAVTFRMVGPNLETRPLEPAQAARAFGEINLWLDVAVADEKAKEPTSRTKKLLKLGRRAVDRIKP